LGAGIRQANAEIQPGSCFGRFDTPGDSDHLVGFFPLNASGWIPGLNGRSLLLAE
jgi:hypothetical protein